MADIEKNETSEISYMIDKWDAESLVFDALNEYLNYENNSEVTTRIQQLRDSLIIELEDIIWETWFESLSQNIEVHKNILIFQSVGGRRFCFNIFNHIKTEPEAMYIWEYSELVSEVHLEWGGLSDHLKAMQVIFDANQEATRWWDYLDDGDTFIFDRNNLWEYEIYDEELLASFNGQTIYQIQQSARIEYRELIKRLWEIPFHILPQEDQDYISDRIDTYTRMIMWVGDMYEGGARLFDKSESEVDFWIHFSIENLDSSEEVLFHWLSIRSEIDENNFQDTTVEQRAYPHYMRTLNSLCYQKMLDLGANRAELLRFAKAVSGHDSALNGGNYSYNHNFTPNHYDSEFANVILGSLIGMPSTEEDNQSNDTHPDGNILERLLENGIMQSVEDDRVENPENLSLLYARAESACDRINKENVVFPKYINDNFFWGRDHGEVTWTYSKLSLADKISISALSRFVDYIEQSIQETPNQESYREQLKENSRILWRHFEDPYQGMVYIEDLWIFRLNVMDMTGSTCFLDIPIEKIQNVSAGRHYIQWFSRTLRENRIVYDTSSQSFQWRDENGERKQFTEQELLDMIGSFEYGNSEGEMIMTASPNISDEYLNALKNLSISESVNHVSDTIMAKFDNWDFNSHEDEFINIETLDSVYDECGRVFSDTDIDILKTWADINGLWESIFEWSDTSNEIKMTGLKIALIIGVSAAAAYATGWLVWMAGFAQAGALIRGYQVVDGVRKSTMAGQMIYGGVMWAYASPVSWAVYPHGYASREEMLIDMLSDVWVSSITWVAGGWLGVRWAWKHDIAATITDFTVLWLATEMARMKVVEEAYHPWENFLDDNEI